MPPRFHKGSPREEFSIPVAETSLCETKAQFMLLLQFSSLAVAYQCSCQLWEDAPVLTAEPKFSNLGRYGKSCFYKKLCASWRSRKLCLVEVGSCAWKLAAYFLAASWKIFFGEGSFFILLRVRRRPTLARSSDFGWEALFFRLFASHSSRPSLFTALALLQSRGQRTHHLFATNSASRIV